MGQAVLQDVHLTTLNLSFKIATMKAFHHIHISWLLPLALTSVYLVYICVYRLFFHPLKHIPGPRLAAISGLYEAFYECFKPGQYHFRVDKMHQRYGTFNGHRVLQ